MVSLSAALCLAYILGLLLTAVPGQVHGVPVAAIACAVSGLGGGLLAHTNGRIPLRPKTWLLMGAVGCFAVGYFSLRLPQPSQHDISRLAHSDSTTTAVEVWGTIDSTPRLTRSEKVQFWLQVRQAHQILEERAVLPQQATGRLYVTVPLLQGTGLYAGQAIAATGQLYKPKSASSPGGFDFQAYLAQQGGFAGLRGEQVAPLATGRSPSWLTGVRQRIVQSQVKARFPEGVLISAMVMGRNGVDLPYQLQDAFAQSGLAHALAASGFQVSLLIQVVLTLTQRCPHPTRLSLSSAILLIYVGLTGLQPAVLRAALMGYSALLAMTVGRKVKPLGSLLLVATVLLAAQPVWIWDIGFQFSFLATLGLLVTVPVLTKWLDWLPTAIAPMLAVPIAAYLWTLPLQLYLFGVVSPYSVLVNVLAAPLITITSLGGMVGSLFSLAHPAAGTWLASVLCYPMHLLIEVVAWGNRLPGSAIAIGTLSTWQMLMLYGLIGLVWWQPQLWRQWWVAAGLGVSLIVLPIGWKNATLLQATVLPTARDPVLVVQDRGQTVLINSSSEANVSFTVLPFLRQQGVNQIWQALAPDVQGDRAAGWYRLAERLPIQALYSSISPAQLTRPTAPADWLNHLLLQQLQKQHGRYFPWTVQQAVPIGSGFVQQLADHVLLCHIGGQRWLLLDRLPTEAQQSLVAAHVLPSVEVLWWTGEALSPQLVAAVSPQVAIASARSIPPLTQGMLQAENIQTFISGQDGAISWTADRGFRAFLAGSTE